MKLASWNIRGFHKPLKHKGVQHLLKKQRINIVGLLETKLSEQSLNTVLQQSFAGIEAAHNFSFSTYGTILVLWDSYFVENEILWVSEQLIHC